MILGYVQSSNTPTNHPQTLPSHTHDKLRKYKKHIASTPSCLQNTTNKVLHLLPPPHYLHPPIPLPNVHLHLLLSLLRLLLLLGIPPLTAIIPHSCKTPMYALTPVYVLYHTHMRCMCSSIVRLRVCTEPVWDREVVIADRWMDGASAIRRRVVVYWGLYLGLVEHCYADD
jgi:hypothetical protein